LKPLDFSSEQELLGLSVFLSEQEVVGLNVPFYALMSSIPLETVIQNAVWVTIAVSVAIGKNRLNAKIGVHIGAKTRFVQLKNFSNAVVSSRIGHVLNH